MLRVAVIDDERLARQGIRHLLSPHPRLQIVGEADSKESALALIRQEKPDGIFLDVHMPGRSGLDILRELNAHHYPTPIFIISGQGDIPMAVQAIKNGAFDFIEKPFDAETVLARVKEAIAAADRRSATGDGIGEVFPGSELLTPREREVLHQIAAGASNKEAGRTLGISPRTIEVHRARIMEKLGAKNAADLVRIVLTNDLR